MGDNGKLSVGVGGGKRASAAVRVAHCPGMADSLVVVVQQSMLSVHTQVCRPASLASVLLQGSAQQHRATGIADADVVVGVASKIDCDCESESGKGAGNVMLTRSMSAFIGGLQAISPVDTDTGTGTALGAFVASAVATSTALRLRDALAVVVLPPRSATTTELLSTSPPPASRAARVILRLLVAFLKQRYTCTIAGASHKTLVLCQ
eukprot:Mycagemm_TRINITY_DN9003_c0_g1::TRINITY_DN9003_c0_g1_i1::g.5373::m.5373 type:complete len:207 gc:universal TRINITY_DN9003_c0_g1_i1:659-39(-)